MIGFLIRLVGYALLLQGTARTAQNIWSVHGLDVYPALQSLHDGGWQVLTVAPFVLALIGIGALRGIAVFVAFALAGAALTAPFALARLVGG